MQGVCDSMQFNTRDSVLYMYTEPVLWNEQYQLYGDTIAIYMNDSTIEYAHVIQFAFAAQHVDSSYYNQLKGNDLKAYFEGQELRRIDVNGNAELNYYPLEKDGSKVGMNNAKGSHLSMWIRNNKLERMGTLCQCFRDLDSYSGSETRSKDVERFLLVRLSASEE